MNRHHHAPEQRRASIQERSTNKSKRVRRAEKQEPYNESSDLGSESEEVVIIDSEEDEWAPEVNIERESTGPKTRKLSLKRVNEVSEKLLKVKHRMTKTMINLTSEEVVVVDIEDEWEPETKNESASAATNRSVEHLCTPCTPTHKSKRTRRAMKQASVDETNDTSSESEEDVVVDCEEDDRVTEGKDEIKSAGTN